MSVFSDLIEYFKTHTDVSSDDIVRDVFSEEYNKIVEENINYGFVIEKSKEYLNLKKKALYYLSKLEKENIIVLSKKAFKGKKLYNFNFSNDNVKVEGSKIIIEKNNSVESFSSFSFSISDDLKDFVYFSDFNTVESVFFDVSFYDENVILKNFELFKYVNDVVVFYNPNSKFFNEKIISLILKYKDKISFSFYFDFENFNFNNTNNFFNVVSFLYSNNFNIILGLSFKDFYSKNFKVFLDVVFKVAFENNSSFHIHNKDVSKDFVFLGSKGPYILDYENFFNLKSSFNNFVFVVSQSSVFLDVKKLLEEKSFSDIRNIILKSGSVLFDHNLFLRQNFDFLFKNIPEYFLDFSNVYFRFWNYGLKEKNINFEDVFLLLESSNNVIKNYSQAQNTIYTSCGLPLRFKSSFSVLFEGKKPNFFSSKKYESIIVNNIKDFFDKNISKILKSKEKANDIFESDRTRFFRLHNKGYDSLSQDLFNELSFIHKTYNFKLYTYDFSKNKKDIVDLKKFF